MNKYKIKINNNHVFWPILIAMHQHIMWRYFVVGKLIIKIRKLIMVIIIIIIIPTKTFKKKWIIISVYFILVPHPSSSNICPSRTTEESLAFSISFLISSSKASRDKLPVYFELFLLFIHLLIYLFIYLFLILYFLKVYRCNL